MLGRMGSSVAAAMILAGCAASVKLEPLPPDHPASAQAAESPIAALSPALQEEPQDAERTAEAAPDRDAATDTEPHAAHPHEEAVAPASAYTCPMHPDVLAAEAGRCPKCGMDLVERKPGQ